MFLLNEKARHERDLGGVFLARVLRALLSEGVNVVDVLIVGAGIAGSVLATLLGRNGFSVELFEQGCFPKEKPCGERLMPCGVAALERMGLAGATGGSPFYGVRYHLRNLTVEGRFPSVAGFASGSGAASQRFRPSAFSSGHCDPWRKAPPPPAPLQAGATDATGKSSR